MQPSWPDRSPTLRHQRVLFKEQVSNLEFVIRDLEAVIRESGTLNPQSSILDPPS